ncbi:penicillin binding protein PBP4B [Microbulbifer hydrolyticus]|uniref:CubicO group peptidase (Beta-lactamase class C family) n=1 Tax=Microbulbifer hydrolyticus TaxID=48074 RepID=A0A6P1T3P7_9GAMM|nr:penicillin binding protein PBP4B [Microbulbifer hydrolyticus]MBB5211707.1 CubicO group peptidase (beta-lactamase class C family) [Microbulbifer hydrolyticus]QHQ37564.1 penicillin binding protein PBP4B [Microbulbifer hydrolyticus]
MRHLARSAIYWAFAYTLLCTALPSLADSAEAINFPELRAVTSPEEAGFSAHKLKELDSLISRDVAAGFPGAVLLIIRDGKIVKNTSYGYRQKFAGTAALKTFVPMTTGTLFDLASNTKMYATNFALQKLVSEGRLDLKARVRDYLPEFRDHDSDSIRGKDDLTVEDVLRHRAGFMADPQYHNQKVAKGLYSQVRDLTHKMIVQTPLVYPPRTDSIYSDVDYMLLGLIIERVTGQRLDEYVGKTIYAPLKLTQTHFNPLQKGFESTAFAATELQGNTRGGIISFPNIRTDTLLGQVHDEKAYYSMAGVSGHAGLFSTTGDLAVLLQVMLNGGGYGDIALFDAESIRAFTEPSEKDPTFALGWRTNGDDSMKWMFGEHASNRAYGHTGWTGTLTVIDPEYDLGIVLLTNKKHSPVIKTGKNTGRFIGDFFAVGRYGEVVSAVYAAMEQKPMEQKRGLAAPKRKVLGLD